MRAYFEALENEILAPYALRSAESAGRRVEEPASKTRTCFQRDRDRIIHSKAFRRLKHKTQVFVALESDHYRTRLTHTLEVAQISRHIARVLRSNEDVAEAIALAHDLGHPPFAHAGEVVMDEMMKGHGGFEHNMQSLRVVDTLEDKYPNVPGLNLSQEIREGLMKHQSPWDQAGKEMIFPSIEAQVVNLSDQIAYNNHDIDDGLESGILTESGLSQNVQLWRAAETHIREQYSQLEDVHRHTLMNSYLISSQVENVVETTEKRLKEFGIQGHEDLLKQREPMVDFDPDMQAAAQELRDYLYNTFYTHPQVAEMNKVGQDLIRDVFKEYLRRPDVLPDSVQKSINDDDSLYQEVCDYVAGMTDVFVRHEHERLCT